MNDTNVVFEGRDLSFRYDPSAKRAVDGVSICVEKGGVYAILGPNGSGKSTLLKLLLGALRPESGGVSYRGLDLAGWNRVEVAREIGVVPQVEEPAFPLTARDLVSMGRYPYLGFWRWEGATDREAVDEAMRRCDVLQFADRDFFTLSGGERQLVRIARALAQEPATLVLDEPTVSLDLRHEMAIFELVRELTTSDSMTVIMVTHNLNLAARYAGRLVFLNAGRLVTEGAPHDVLSKTVLEQIYHWPLTMTTHPGPGADTGAPQVVPLGRDGDQTSC